MDKKLHTLLRTNIRALGDEPRIFCFVADEPPHLYVDKAKSDPALLASSKKASTMISVHLPSTLNFPSGVGFASGTVTRTGGTCVFTVVHVKTLSDQRIREGIQGFRDEVGTFRVEGEVLAPPPPPRDLPAQAREWLRAHPPTRNAEVVLRGYLAAQVGLPETLDTEDGQEALDVALTTWRQERYLTRLVKDHAIVPDEDVSCEVYLRRIAEHVPEELWKATDALEDLFQSLRRRASKARVAEVVEEAPTRRAPDHEDPTTWTLGDLVVLFDESAVSAASDWANYRDQVARGELRSEHGGLRWDVPFHKHLQSGSWGISFVYRLEDREAGTVTPVIYDYATKRQGNDYVWERGGRNGGPSGASVR